MSCERCTHVQHGTAAQAIVCELHPFLALPVYRCAMKQLRHAFFDAGCKGMGQWHQHKTLHHFHT